MLGPHEGCRNGENTWSSAVDERRFDGPGAACLVIRPVVHTPTLRPDNRARADDNGCFVGSFERSRVPALQCE